MDLFIPGTISELGQIEPGTCILFCTDGTVRAGMVVKPGSGEKAILDFERPDDAHGAGFHIYNGSHFQGEPIISLPQARIVPSLDAGALGTGLYARGVLSRVLYLTDRGPTIYAGFQRSAYKISLANGDIFQGDISDQIYTLHWRIETMDGAGNFNTLRDFKV